MTDGFGSWLHEDSKLDRNSDYVSLMSTRGYIRRLRSFPWSGFGGLHNGAKLIEPFVGFRKPGIHADRLAKIRGGFIVSTAHRCNHSQAVVGLGVLGIDLHGVMVLCGGIIEITLDGQNRTEIVMRLGVVGIQRTRSEERRVGREC